VKHRPIACSLLMRSSTVGSWYPCISVASEVFAFNNCLKNYSAAEIAFKGAYGEVCTLRMARIKVKWSLILVKTLPTPLLGPLPAQDPRLYFQVFIKSVYKIRVNLLSFSCEAGQGAGCFYRMLLSLPQRRYPDARRLWVTTANGQKRRFCRFFC
jgi:hypothetical protein